MKVCKIIDEYRRDLIIGYLFYYEKEDVFSIELDDSLDEGDVPLFLSLFMKRGEYTVSPEWSSRWAETRVIPRDRQNLGMILKNSGMKEYDVFKLLMYSNGRCAQDDCAIVPVKYEMLPAWVTERRSRKLEFAVMLGRSDLITVFREGSVYRTDLSMLADEVPHLASALRSASFMSGYRVMAGGVGILIGGSLTITAEKLYGMGTKLPITGDELRIIAGSYVMDTREVCSEMSCSRQYVDQLTKSSCLSVLKDGGTRIYARSDVRKATE